MIQKIISLIVAFIMSAGSVSAFSLSGVRDAFTVALFGLPCTDEAVNEDYADELSDAEVIVKDRVSGFFRNKLMLILSPGTGFFEKKALFAKEGLSVIGWCTPVELYVVRYAFAGFSDMEKECEKLEKNPAVIAAMPLTASKVTPQFTPDDPFESESLPVWDELRPSGDNWWLEATEARRAWDYSGYFSPVTLGITDSGFDTGHREFEGKITFPSSRQAKLNEPSAHGNHVAGIIAAAQNNGYGISGICPHATLICEDWHHEEKKLWNSDLNIFIDFVLGVMKGAKVLNFSLGSSSSIAAGENSLSDFSIKAESFFYSYAMSRLLKRGYDFLVVQSAGNGNEEGKSVDARNAGLFASVFSDNRLTILKKSDLSDIMDHIILVGAARSRGGGKYMQTTYSNSGPEVEIAAPGSGIYSCTYPEEFGYMGGTSMAAPMVTGAAGLIWSVNPSLSGSEVKKILISSADKTASANDDDFYIGNYEKRDLPMLNIRLCVEEALRRAHPDFGTVTGTADGAQTVVYAEKSYTVLSDGTFGFLVPAGEGEITALDENGEVIYTASVAVSGGETSEVILTPPEEEPEEGTENG